MDQFSQILRLETPKPLKIPPLSSPPGGLGHFPKIKKHTSIPFYPFGSYEGVLLIFFSLTLPCISRTMSPIEEFLGQKVLIFFSSKRFYDPWKKTPFTSSYWRVSLLRIHNSFNSSQRPFVIFIWFCKLIQMFFRRSYH